MNFSVTQLAEASGGALVDCAEDLSKILSIYDNALHMTSDSMIGRKVAGRYTITGIIGQGGMGTVYSAIQDSVDREVALKVIKAQYVSDPEFGKRFEREAKAVSLLKHPNTVTLFDFGHDDDGMAFLALERIDGESLEGILARGEIFPWRDALRIARQIAESLAEAHDRGIIHRDIKPDNIFLVSDVTGRTRIKVLDFSVARMERPEGQDSKITQHGTGLGTPGYMSPEQCQGRDVDVTSDVYALGVVLFELLTGRPPFEADNIVMLLTKHIVDEPPSLRAMAREGAIPGAVDNLIQKLLAKNPKQRPQSAKDLILTLDRLIEMPDEASESVEDDDFDGEDRVTTPPNRTTMAPSSQSQGKLRLILVVSAVVVVLAGITTGLILALTSETEETALQAVPTQGITADGASEVEEHVKIQLRAYPEEARMWLDGKLLETNPFTIERRASEQDHQLVVKAEGYEDLAKQIRLNRSTTVELKLTPIREDIRGRVDASPQSPDSERNSLKRRGKSRGRGRGKGGKLPIFTEPPGLK